MNLARQALIFNGIQIHAALWPGLSTLIDITDVFDGQIEAMMKNHAFTGQCFVICATNPFTQEMYDYMEKELGPQQLMTSSGGGWSAIIHPSTSALAGPHTGEEEKILIAEINLEDIKDAKVWLDTAGHYSRPEIFSLFVDTEKKQGFYETIPYSI